MRIDGLQKMTLLDFPGKVACTVFTGGCNFCCPFCHNALLVTELPENPDYTADEVLDFLKKIAQFVVYIIAKHKMLFSTKRSRFRHEGVKNCRLRFP